VGTRPEMPRYVAHYTDEMKATILLSAGVTSLAAITFKDEDELMDGAVDPDRVYVENVLLIKMKYNLQSIETFGFWRDVECCLIRSRPCYEEKIFGAIRRPKVKNKLIKKIQNREITVGVVGLGYVGLPLSVEKARAGFRTIGFDVQSTKVEMVNNGENYIGDVVDDDLKELVDSGMLSATSDFGFIKDVDFVAICVPTPLDAHQQPDIRDVRSSTEAIAKHLTKETIVVLESTTYPGTTEDLLRPILEEGSGLKCGEDFYLGFSPERVDPGNLIYKTKNTPKVVGAIGKDATEVIAMMYRAVLDSDVFESSSPAIAEMEKILENTYRNINIGLANEMAILCDKMGIDYWEVVDAASTKPYGFQAFYPGPGLGGHCIPLDPYYLSWKAREYGFHTSMIESSMMINDKMPEYCVERASKVLNQFKKSLNGSKILVLGIAYKQDIDDYRESPAIDVINILKGCGGEVDFYDPYISQYKDGGEMFKGLDSIDPKTVASYDLVMITASHSNLDYDMIQKNAVAIFDTKNAMKKVLDRDNIELL
jgi:UDP-N-acetyl-D-glucosamine dehydrogenase